MTLSLDLLLKERDLGTPPADRKTRGGAPSTVEVVIDGLTVTGGSTAIAMIVPKSRIASAQGMQGATQTVIAGIASVAAGSAYGAYGRTTTFVSAACIMIACIAVGSWMVREHIHMKGSDVLDPGSTGLVEPLL